MIRPTIRALLIAMLTFAVMAPAFAADPTIEELLDATDDVARGTSSHAVMEMYVKTNRYERTMKLEAWSKGTDKTLIRILEPAKDAGITTLKVDDNIWNHMPKVDRTMKVPAGMMSGSWMGSHFSNDDLVKASRLREDYDASIVGRPGDDGKDVYTIQLIPKPNAAVVWGRQVLEVRADKVPVEARYYDEKERLVRTMSWADVKAYGDRLVPSTMTLTPADKPEEQTRMRYHHLDFDANVPDSLFSLQSLKK